LTGTLLREIAMNSRFDQIAFGGSAYLLFVVCIVTALAFADFPTPVFLAFLAMVVVTGLAAEGLSRLASKKLIEMSAPAETEASAQVDKWVVAFTRVEIEVEPDFVRTSDWFDKTAIGSFA
jgi:hypothetical protein